MRAYRARQAGAAPARAPATGEVTRHLSDRSTPRSESPVNTRTRVIAGYAIGAAAAALLIILATIAIVTDHPLTPAYALGVGLVVLLGDIAAKLVISADYVRGVGDTVDRLAEALPRPDNVRRIS